MPWTIDNYSEISNIDDAITRWQTFIKTASATILNAVHFNLELSKKLQDARLEIEDLCPNENTVLSKDDWMILSEIIPNDCHCEENFDVQVDKNYNWHSHTNNYTTTQLETVSTWLSNMKTEFDLSTNEEHLPIVHFDQLNRLQKFAYNLIEKKINQNEQLLLIINGTAGKYPLKPVIFNYLINQFK